MNIYVKIDLAQGFKTWEMELTSLTLKSNLVLPTIFMFKRVSTSSAAMEAPSETPPEEARLEFIFMGVPPPLEEREDDLPLGVFTVLMLLTMEKAVLCVLIFTPETTFPANFRFFSAGESRPWFSFCPPHIGFRPL